MLENRNAIEDPSELIKYYWKIKPSYVKALIEENYKKRYDKQLKRYVGEKGEEKFKQEADDFIKFLINYKFTNIYNKKLNETGEQTEENIENSMREYIRDYISKSKGKGLYFKKLYAKFKIHEIVNKDPSVAEAERNTLECRLNSVGSNWWLAGNLASFLGPFSSLIYYYDYFKKGEKGLLEEGYYNPPIGNYTDWEGNDQPIYGDPKNGKNGWFGKPPFVTELYSALAICVSEGASVLVSHILEQYMPVAGKWEKRIIRGLQIFGPIVTTILMATCPEKIEWDAQGSMSAYDGDDNVAKFYKTVFPKASIYSFIKTGILLGFYRHLVKKRNLINEVKTYYDMELKKRENEESKEKVVNILEKLVEDANQTTGE